MKPDIRKVLCRCIEYGLESGYNRAHKHDSNPNKDRILEEIDNAIWLEIYEYFNFDDENSY